MAQFSMTVPDQLVPVIGEACRRTLGDAGTGLNNAQAARAVVKAYLKGLVCTYRLQTELAVANATANSAADKARIAADDAVTALRNSNATILASVESDFASVI